MDNRSEGILSKVITSSGVVTTAGKTGLLWGVSLYTAAADSKIIIEDGGSGGTALLTVAGDGTNDATSSKSVMFAKPVVGVTDLYATISGAGATAEVFYEEIEN